MKHTLLVIFFCQLLHYMFFQIIHMEPVCVSRACLMHLTNSESKLAGVDFTAKPASPRNIPSSPSQRNRLSDSAPHCVWWWYHGSSLMHNMHVPALRGSFQGRGVKYGTICGTICFLFLTAWICLSCTRCSVALSALLAVDYNSTKLK